MKETISDVISAARLMLLLLLFTACQRNSESHDVYTCPMHPTVVSSKPGACPVCNMELVKKLPGAEMEIGDKLARATQPPNAQVLSGVSTVKGEFKALPVEITRMGIVTYDARNRSTIASRTAGRLEKVFVKYLYQHVHKGELLATIYSPELAAAQQELLQVQDSDPANEVLLNAAMKRLLNLGMSEKQITKVLNSKIVQLSVSIYSPLEGYIVQRNGQAPGAPASTAPYSPGGMPGEMADESSTTPQDQFTQGSGSDLLREGAYISPGQVLFSVVSLSSLVIELNLPAAAAGTVRRGDRLEVDVRGEKADAVIDLVQPFATAGEPFVKVRSYVRNNSKLSVGQLVTATVRLSPAEGLWIPSTAVLDLGIRKLVFVKDKDYFRPVGIETGMTTAGQVMVISGIASSDEIAASPQFLVDHEGFVKTDDGI